MDKVLLTARYVEGDLNAQEYRDFESEIVYDEELQEYLKGYKTMHVNLSGQIKEAFGFASAALPKSSVETYVAEKITHTMDYIWYLTVALVITVGLFIWKPWTPNLYEEFKISDKQIAAEITDAPYKDFTLAANFVSNKQYYDAKLLVSKLYMKSPDDLKLSYYYAVILLQNHSYDTIDKVLAPVLSSNTGYKDAAAYVMALSNLQQKNPLACQEWLGKIDKHSSYYESASLLKSQLAAQSI